MSFLHVFSGNHIEVVLFDPRFRKDDNSGVWRDRRSVGA